MKAGRKEVGRWGRWKKINRWMREEKEGMETDRKEVREATKGRKNKSELIEGNPLRHAFIPPLPLIFPTLPSFLPPIPSYIPLSPIPLSLPFFPPAFPHMIYTSWQTSAERTEVEKTKRMAWGEKEGRKASTVHDNSGGQLDEENTSLISPSPKLLHFHFLFL